MKRVVFYCMIVAVLTGALATAAYAEIREYGFFTINVPEEWTVKEEESFGGWHTIMANDPAESAIKSIAYVLAPGLPAAEASQYFSFGMGGSKPVNKGTHWAFTVEMENFSGECRVMDIGENVLAECEFGNLETARQVLVYTKPNI